MTWPSSSLRPARASSTHCSPNSTPPSRPTSPIAPRSEILARFRGFRLRPHRDAATTTARDHAWNGATQQGDVIVMATGTWTESLFARHLRPVLKVVREDVVVVAPPSGSPAYDSTHFPWSVVLVAAGFGHLFKHGLCSAGSLASEKREMALRPRLKHGRGGEPPQ